MKRNLGRLADEPFDILVVGGGIHGAAIVREAVARGYKTALIEQGDFGQATSANSLKIIHGGLRYLQQGDFKRMRQSIKARRMFMQRAPHLVHPCPFLIPIYGHGLRGKEAMTTGLVINDLLSWDRNRSLTPDNLLPSGKVISREECLEILPHLAKKGLTGGAVWYDGLAANTERLTLEFVLIASELDAVVINYVQAKTLVFQKGTLIGVEAQDRITKTRFTIRSRWVINAAGPWLNSLLEDTPDAVPLPIRWTQGINLIINRPLFSAYGIGLGGGKALTSSRSSSKKKERLFFFVPWQGRTMVGTAYKRYEGDLGEYRLKSEDIQEFLDELNSIYPPGRLTLEDVSFFHFGLLPLSEGQDPVDLHTEPDRHFRLIDHEPLMKMKGLLSVKSTKYTTAPVAAQKIVDLVAAKGKGPLPEQEDSKKLSSYDETSLLNDLIKINQAKIHQDQGQIARHLHQNYGSKSKSIITYLKKDLEMGRLISTDPPIMAAEIVHGVKEEMALKLSDVVFRRTDLGQYRCPSLESLQATSRIMARELGWNESRIQEELQEVLAVYRPLSNRTPLFANIKKNE